MLLGAHLYYNLHGSAWQLIFEKCTLASIFLVRISIYIYTLQIETLSDL